MFALIWASLLFSVRGASVEGRGVCQSGSCITLNEGEITAEAGLCVVIPCSLTTDYVSIPQNVVWLKCEPSKQKCGDSDMIFHSNKYNNKVQSGFKGRVSLLEPDLVRKNCSIIINDLTESDSGSYQFRVKRVGNPKTDGLAFSKKAEVSVKGLTQKPTVIIPPLKEGQQTTLTCTAPGLCSGSAPEITWTWRGAGENDSHITGNITSVKTENLTAVTQRHSSSLTFNSSATQHHGTEVTCKVSFTNSITTEETVTLNVTYVKELKISGNPTVKEGDALNLTCSVDSFPVSLIMWTKFGSNKSLHENKVQKHDGRASLIIGNMTVEQSGQYICTATHLNNTLMKKVNVTLLPRILKTSKCEVQLEVLTCVCVSQAFPLPTIKWPLLKDPTEYSVITTVSHHTVISTVTLTVKDHGDTDVECVSSNENGEAKENLTIILNELKQEDLLKKLLITVKQPQVIIAFLTGILISATICCLARKCHRKKPKSSGNMVETLEMVTTQVVPLMDAGQSVESDRTCDQEAADRGAEAAGQSVPECDVEPEEVEYSDIDFSRCNRQSLTRAKDTQQTTETEYAEIMREEPEKRQDNCGEDGEVIEGNEQEVVTIGEDKETKQCVSAQEEEREDVVVYSNVNEVMAEI